MNVKESPSSRTESAQNPVVTADVGDGESVARAVVTAVSSASDADEHELRPLYEVIDPEALDAVFGSFRDGRPRQCEGSVVFEYAGHEVCVESGGIVRVYRPQLGT